MELKNMSVYDAIGIEGKTLFYNIGIDYMTIASVSPNEYAQIDLYKCKEIALVFSKAYKMLEMLDKAAHKLYSVENPSTSCRILADEIMDLINESTEL